MSNYICHEFVIIICINKIFYQILKMFNKNKIRLFASILVLKELKILKAKEEKNRRRIKRKWWVKPLLMKRDEHDLENYLLRDVFAEGDDKDFQNFSRLSIHEFEYVLAKISVRITKLDTVLRKSISPRAKLAITLRYIATGDSYKSLEFLSRISRITIGAFVPEVLSAIYTSLQPTYLKIPATEEEWTNISNDFNTIWQFPHTLGALDGKHIRINAPAHTGSSFYNFKGFYSIVLFALVDAHGRFLFIDVGCNGKASDSTIYNDGYFYNALKKGMLNIPPESQLVVSKGNNIPFFFIGDDAFALNQNLMKPFNRNAPLTVQEEIFNYRLCRARMTVECAFGKLANRFRIFHRPIEVLPETVDLIVMCSCVLHNYLTQERKKIAITDDEIKSIPLPKTFSNIQYQDTESYKYSCRIRNELAKYLITDGNEPFQLKKVNMTSNN